MEEEADSWIRRTKFSSTLFHRVDSSRFVSFPLRNLHLASDSLREKADFFSIARQSVSFQATSKQRSSSPQAETVKSDVFKEARSVTKRFSTPLPRGRRRNNGLIGTFLRKESQEDKLDELLGCFHPSRNNADLKMKKESAWNKYFDNGGRRVNAVDAIEDGGAELCNLFVGPRFAHGAHSKLHHGRYKEEEVAVKIIMIPDHDDDADDDENRTLAARLDNQFHRETSLLSRLHHPNVVKLVTAGKNQNAYFIVTEYLSEGSLRAYLHSHGQVPIQLQKLIAIALDIARGMEYVHAQGVIHRDLKPENVLIDKDFHLKIADFGIARDATRCDLLADDDPGTYRWMAPEMIKRKPYGPKVDVYGFGLILWEMVTGKVPYGDMNPIQAAFAVVHKNVRPVVPPGCQPAMRCLIEQCWALQPAKRPEFWQIVKALEQFQSSLALDGTLNLLPKLNSQDHHNKKSLLEWIHKLSQLKTDACN